MSPLWGRDALGKMSGRRVVKCRRQGEGIGRCLPPPFLLSATSISDPRIGIASFHDWGEGDDIFLGVGGGVVRKEGG